MTSIISRCSICGQFFNSIKELKNHKDRNHRITTGNMRKRANDNSLDQPWSLDPSCR
jgi:hypothetical protein